MGTAAAAAEYKTNIGLDITLSDAFDAEYVDEPEEDEAAARQALNQFMAEYYGIE